MIPMGSKDAVGRTGEHWATMDLSDEIRSYARSEYGSDAAYVLLQIAKARNGQRPKGGGRVFLGLLERVARASTHLLEILGSLGIVR